MITPYLLPSLLPFFEAAARSGSRYAQWKVGNCHLEGRFTDRDSAAAVAFYTQAADAGLRLAQRDLGRLYAEGIGVPVDFAKAAALFERAAIGCDHFAQLWLGKAYLFGSHGLGQDIERGRTYLAQAASNGNGDAHYLLAYHTALDTVMPFSPHEAMTRLQHAAESGNADASYALAILQREIIRDTGKAWEQMAKAAAAGCESAQLELLVRESSTSDNVDTALEATTKILDLAKSGLVAAMHQIGLSYAYGFACPRDADQARVWLRQAAEQGYAKAKCALAELLLGGDAAPAKDVRWGIKLHLEAAKLGFTDSISQLGDVPIVNATVVSEGSELGYKLLLHAAELGNTRASYRLAFLHNYTQTHVDHDLGMFWVASIADDFHGNAQAILGHETFDAAWAERNQALAVRLLTNAHHLGEADASYRLAQAYFWGLEGLIRNKKVAAGFFLAAAKGGHTKAMNNIGVMLLTGEGVGRDEAAGQQWLEASRKGEAVEVAVEDQAGGDEGLKGDNVIDFGKRAGNH